MASLLSSLFVKVSADTREFADGLKGAERTLKDFGGRVTSAGVALTAGITAPLVGSGLAAITAAGQYEQANIAFSTLMGSAEKGTALLKQLQDFSQRTPFEFQGLQEAAKRLLALGFAGKDVIPVMTSIGNAVAALGGGAELINRVTTALGQMKAKGTVQAEEMRQLAEAGIPAWDILAKKIGVSIPEAMKLVEKRAVEASTAVPAILAGMNERFGGMMEAQNKTLLGQWSNFKDKLYMMLVDVGTPLLDTAKRLLENMTPVLQVVADLAKSFSELSPGMQQFILSAAAASAALGPLLMGIGGVSMGIGSLVGAIRVMAPLVASGATGFANMAGGLTSGLIPAASAAAPALTALAGALSAAAVAAAAFAIYKTWDAWSKYRDAVKEAGQAATDQEKSLKKLEDSLRAQGVVVERGNLSWRDYMLKLQAAAIELGKHKKAADDQNGAFKGLNEAQRKTAELYMKLGMSAEDARKLVLALTGGHDKQRQELKRLNTDLLDHTVALGKAKRAVDDAKTAQMLMGDTMEDAAQEAIELTRQLDAMGRKALDVSKIKGPEFQGLTDLNNRIKETEAAYKTLGITHRASSDEMVAAYERLKREGIASQRELLEAERAVLQARISENRAAGIAITADQQARLNELDAALGTHNEKQKSSWKELGNQISTILTDMSKGIADLIFNGGSLKDVFVGTFKEIGEAIVRHFIELGIKKAIAAVGDLLTSLGGVGAKIADIVGIGGSVSGGATSAGGSGAGAVGSAGGAAGGLGGAVSGGVMGTIGAIGSVGSMVSGIIGNFQNAKMETSLNAIEESTRYSALYLGKRGDQGILGAIFKTNEELAWGVQTKATEAIRDTLRDLHGYLVMKLDSIHSEIAWGAGVKAMERVADRISAGMGATINLTVNVPAGSDGRTIGAEAAAEINRRFAFA